MPRHFIEKRKKLKIYEIYHGISQNTGELATLKLFGSKLNHKGLKFTRTRQAFSLKPLEKFQGSCKCRPDIHVKCMENLFTQNGRTCPICRQKYPETDVQKKENEEKPEETCVAACLCCYICCLPFMSLLQ